METSPIMDVIDAIDAEMLENTVEQFLDDISEPESEIAPSEKTIADADGAANDAASENPKKIVRRRRTKKTAADAPPECPICCDPYNRALRTEIVCSYADCGYSACKTCVRTYLTNTLQEPHCMHCKKPFDDEFMFKHLNRSYCKTDFRAHRRKILFDLEVSKIPETMPAVERQIRVEEIQEENTKLNDDIYELERQIRKVRREIDANNTKIVQIRGGVIGKNEERRKFIMPCPNEGCRGFLSTAYKCEICKYYTCPKCLELVGTEKPAFGAEGDGAAGAADTLEDPIAVDGDADEEAAAPPQPQQPRHVCNPDCVKNAEAIRKETRACPSCGSRIFKIEGCSQIWCTSCHVAFDWNTGRIDEGIIHNPHFFEWQRKGGGAARVAGAAGAAAHCDGPEAAANAWNTRRYNINTILERMQKYIASVGLDILAPNGREDISSPRTPHSISGHMENSHNVLNHSHIGKQMRDKAIEQLHQIRIYTNTVNSIVRVIEHVAHVVMRDAREKIRVCENNEQMRILYILKRISDDEFADMVYKNSIVRKKVMEKYHVYELLTTVGREWVRTISQIETIGEFLYIPTAPSVWTYDKLSAAMTSAVENYGKKVDEIEEFFTYCNDQFTRIANIYNERAYGVDINSEGYYRYEWRSLPK